MEKKFCIIVAGATGVGKTEFSLHLGESLPIEIINADLGQFYTPLTIGTAKPQWHDESIKHHLFDIFDEPQCFTVMQYRSILLKTMQSIWARNKIPVIVGGSTLYIESIFFELPTVVSSPSDQPFEVDDLLLWDTLNSIDSVRASEIHPNDSYRLIRALAVWNSTGIKPSELKPRYNPLAPFYYYIFTRDRDDLYARINNRVAVMFEQGWLDEVVRLQPEWHSFIETKKFIGYPDIYEYMAVGRSQDTLKDLIERIAQKTRNYAKRQETYWRRLEKKISHCLVTMPEYTRDIQSSLTRVNLTSCNLAVYSKQQAKLIDTINERK